MTSALSAFIAAMMLVLPKAAIAILMKFASEKFVQAYLEKLIIVGLKAAAKLTVNTVDDEFAAMVEARLKEPAENG